MPVHTAYVGAHAASADTPREWGREARRYFEARFPNPRSLVSLGIGRDLAGPVHERVAARLAATPLEDLRLDFEDGYAGADDAAEDLDAHRCGRAMAEAASRGERPPRWGLRIRSTALASRERALRTLDELVAGTLEAGGGAPALRGFVVTLAKVVEAAEVAALAEHLARRESEWGVPAGSLAIELMAETPESILAPDGRAAAPALVAAGNGRCVGVHLGVYDYTASLGVVGPLQGPRHPICDHAREVLQVALAGTGVELSDGSPRIVPTADGEGPATAAEREVCADVRHALKRAVYRGWDMAPAHTVLRAIASIAFFRELLDEIGTDEDGAVLEDAATRRADGDLVRRAEEHGALP